MFRVVYFMAVAKYDMHWWGAVYLEANSLLACAGRWRWPKEE